MAFVLALLLFLLPAPAWAALSVDSTSTHQQDADADPWTSFNHTVAADANLLVCLVFVGSNATAAVTFNGDALTEEIRNDNPTVYIFKRVNPDVGTFSVVVNPNVSIDGAAICRSYKGADTTTPLTATASVENASASTSSMTLTCPAGNEALGIVATAGNRAITPTQTSILAENDGEQGYAMSSTAGAGSTTLDYSWGAGSISAQAVTCVMASTAGRHNSRAIVVGQ